MSTSDFPDLQRCWRHHEQIRFRFFSLRRFLVNYSLEAGLGVEKDIGSAGSTFGRQSTRASITKRTSVQHSSGLLEEMAKMDEEVYTADERAFIIIKAVEQGKLNRIRSYLQLSGVREDRLLWNKRNTRGDTPLLVAIKDKEVSMVQLLCSNWPVVDIDAKDVLNVSCLHHLIILQFDSDVVDFFLDRANLATCDTHGWGIGQICAYYGNMSVLQKLEARGLFKIPYPDRTGPPIIKAIPRKKGQNSPDGSPSKTDAQDQELAAGADLVRMNNVANKNMVHTQWNNPGIIATIANENSTHRLNLLHHKPKQPRKPPGGDSMDFTMEEMESAEDLDARGQETASKLRQSYGIILRKKSSDLISPRNGNNSLRKKKDVFERMKSLCALEEEQPQVTAKGNPTTATFRLAKSIATSGSLKVADEEEETQEEVPLGPLHIASASGHLKVCEFLVTKCAQDPAEVNPTNGGTPLHYACRSGKADVVRFLLEYTSVRVKVNLQEKTAQMTALHYAAQINNIEIVRLLTNLTRVDAIGVRAHLGGELTALDVARKRHLTGWLLGTSGVGPEPGSPGAGNSKRAVGEKDYCIPVEYSVEMEELMKRCNVCRRMRSAIICYRCGLALYCSANCQRLDWKQHKKNCVSKSMAPTAPQNNM